MACQICILPTTPLWTHYPLKLPCPLFSSYVDLFIVHNKHLFLLHLLFLLPECFTPDFNMALFSVYFRSLCSEITLSPLLGMCLMCCSSLIHFCWCLCTVKKFFFKINSGYKMLCANPFFFKFWSDQFLTIFWWKWATFIYGVQGISSVLVLEKFDHICSYLPKKFSESLIYFWLSDFS